MKFSAKRSKALSSVFAVLLMVIITFAAGILLVGYVVSSVDSAKNVSGTPTTSLILRSVAINETHIAAVLQNCGTCMVEITSAYVNGLIGALTETLTIGPNLTGTVCMLGTFARENTYSVELLSRFSKAIKLEITY